jgi:hypothetical protein
MTRPCEMMKQACALAGEESDINAAAMNIGAAQIVSEDLQEELEDRIDALIRLTNKQANALQYREGRLTSKNEQIVQQSQEIDNKMKLIDTRNRMLQLSMERNLYKKKVIYTLFSCIIAVLILMLLVYSYFNKKK